MVSFVVSGAITAMLPSRVASFGHCRSVFGGPGADLMVVMGVESVLHDASFVNENLKGAPALVVRTELCDVDGAPLGVDLNEKHGREAASAAVAAAAPVATLSLDGMTLSVTVAFSRMDSSEDAVAASIDESDTDTSSLTACMDGERLPRMV